MRFNPQAKLALHPQFSRYMDGERIYPVNIEVSPSGTCNAQCIFCFYSNTGELGEHRAVFLDVEKAFAFIDEAAQLGVKSITWTGGGDPSLHPEIDRLVERVFSVGMQQGMFTNALAKPKYNPELMEWIRITPTNRPMIGNYIAPLRAAKCLGFAFNYSGPQDDDYLKHVLAVAAGLENCQYVQVRPALKFHGETVSIDPPSFTHPLLQITWYKFDEAKRKHSYKTCEGYHFTPFLWEDGNLDVCAYMRRHKGYTLGNIYTESLKDILDRAPQSVPVHENCQVCCKLHETNLLIHSSRELEDRNFP